MATYKARGDSHSIIYRCDTPEGKKQQWETYTTELEAMQRKAYIDYLQKNNLQSELSRAAEEFKERRAAAKASQEASRAAITVVSEHAIPAPAAEDNTDKTYLEFVEKWLPFQARKNRFSPNTYDNYASSLKNHIIPYFGNRVMSTITSEDIDNFVDYLSHKPCMGSKNYHRSHGDALTLSSGSVKKCYNILTSSFTVAKKWRYVKEVPETTAPTERWKKRKAWEPGQVHAVLSEITDDKLLHLTVHIAFVCSLRAGEVAGIDIRTIDLHDGSLWITQQVQRVSDEALTVLPKDEIIRVFPKQASAPTSSLILKGPKTEGSYRKQYLTLPLQQEIRDRITQIKKDKEYLAEEYQDYGLLICQPDGRPIDPKLFDKWFKEHQRTTKIENQIEFQGLRKSGQMHKVRLTQNNYQLVAENSGQSPEVLMSNYNEALDSEKRALSVLVETSFYTQPAIHNADPTNEAETILQMLDGNPELMRQIMQSLLPSAAHA